MIPQIKIMRDRFKGPKSIGLRALRLFEAQGVIFVRVPKNASTTLCKFLYKSEDKKIYPSHVSAEYYRRAIPRQYAKLPVVACLREPLSRFKSAFNYYRHTTPFPEEKHIIATCIGENGSFDDFTDYLQRQKDLDQTPIMQWDHFRRQSDFICSEDGRLIVDVLFTTGKLDLGVAVLRDIVQTPLPADIGVENRSIKEDRDIKLPDKVTAFYQDDVRLWKAVFDKGVLYPVNNDKRGIPDIRG